MPYPADKVLDAVGENLTGGPVTDPVSGWDDSSNKIQTRCGAWKPELGGTTKTQKITISSAKKDVSGKVMYDFLTTDITVECKFAICSNKVAQDLKEFKPSIAMPETVPIVLDFWIDKDLEPQVIQLYKFQKWCPNHTERLNMISGKVTQQ